MHNIARKTLVLLLAALGLLVLAPAFANSLPTAHLTMVVMHTNKAAGVQGKPGPDGGMHDAFMPSDIVVQPGQKVDLTVINYDDGAHSITAPEINLNLMAQGGTFNKDETAFTPGVTHFSFTAPSKVGYYRWFCVVPCDGEPAHWAMQKTFDGQGVDGYMAGYIVVR